MNAASMALGRYVARGSPVHRTDAAAKLLGACCLATASVWSESLAVQSAQAGLLLVVFALARLPVRLLGQALRGALWLLAFVALANLGWAAVAGAWAEPQSPTALAVLLLRLLDLILLSVVFTATTVPVDLAHGIERLLRPLGRLRLPVHEVGLLLVMSLSFIPIFFSEARVLAAAHRSKMGGVRWGFRHRAGAIVPLAVPLFLGVLRRADELAVALDARCFLPGRPRSAFVPPRSGANEMCCLALCGLVLVVSLWPRP